MKFILPLSLRIGFYIGREEGKEGAGPGSGEEGNAFGGTVERGIVPGGSYRLAYREEGERTVPEREK